MFESPFLRARRELCDPSAVKRSSSWWRFGVAVLLVSLFATVASAGPRERAKHLHDRLVGIPPSPEVLDDMADLLETEDPVDALAAADLAMENPTFYDTALKNFVTPWTNVDQSVFAELNDYTATVIGMIRDDIPFNEVLSRDIVYVGAQQLITDGVIDSAYSHTDNEHYKELEAARVDLSDVDVLVSMPQSGLLDTPLNTNETAGVITTRAAGEAFFSAGTNRRMWRFTSMNYLCRDLEDLKDISRPADRIRQDVSRSPGGDSSIFQNHCVGCHSGMDPVAGAYAYYEWDDEMMRTTYSRGNVQGKYQINATTFPFGFITEDDYWVNYWREGQNSALGWRGEVTDGFGAKSLGLEVTGSRAFAVCQVEKVFQQTCFRPAESVNDRIVVEQVATIFETEGYSMKRVFAETALYCTQEVVDPEPSE